METETGKSCVYLSIILELNKCYGFTKLVAVMPSVAFGPQLQTMSVTVGAISVGESPARYEVATGVEALLAGLGTG